MRDSYQRRIAHILLLIAWGMTTPNSAESYSVSSGVSDPCHEMITDLGGRDIILDMPLEEGVVPSNKVWRDLGKPLLESVDIDLTGISDKKRFLLTSLLIGVRAPDTDGHSIMNLENLHELHGDPSAKGQYAHGLRGKGDDYSKGDAAAVMGTRELIAEQVEQGADYLSRPHNEQIINAPFYLDFYGRVDVPVWAPLYFAGRAVHALQDTFSHTIRSSQDNLKKVVHVLNYIDAISSDFDEDRDGLAHSDSMDKCLSEDIKALFNASVEATRDLLMAVKDEFLDTNPNAIRGVLDEWLTYKPGCSKDNMFCDNEQWLKVVRKEQTGPYLEGIFGCSTIAGARNSFLGTIALVFLLLGAAICFRKRGRPSVSGNDDIT